MGKCIVCKIAIKKSRDGVKYCSNRCKQKAYYRRKYKGINYYFREPINGRYDFQEYLEVKNILRDKIEIDYISYCFLRITAPNLNSIKDVDYQINVKEKSLM
tara:strand:+ start:104 stop:409 length:306 start_codon:yes stop_codon:yes gene_type:complete